MNEYTATYDYTNSAQNGLNQERIAWTVASSSEVPSNGPDFTIANNFSASRPFQVEFNRVAELDSQTSNTYYSKISTEDNNRFVLSTSQSNYVLHKFEFEIDENEYRSDEVSPKRIESIEINWEGYPELT